MSCAAITSMSGEISRSVSLSGPHQLTLMAPAPDARIHFACCSMTASEAEL